MKTIAEKSVKFIEVLGESNLRESPLISIIIPTYNRPEQLNACLLSLTQQRFDSSRFEVIVVDDGSPTSIEALAGRFLDRLELRIIRQQDNRGPAAARNIGAYYARGEILAFTDDDCRPDTNWLPSLRALFRRYPDRLIGGKTLNLLKENVYSEASQLIIDFVYAHYNVDHENARFFASNNMAVPALDFHTLGGFNPSFRTAEDREFCDRWRHSGRHMIFAKDAIVKHTHNLTLSSYFFQHFKYGQGAYQYHLIRAHRGSGSIWKDLTFYNSLAHLMRQSFSGLGVMLTCSLLALLLLWQVANAVGAIWEGASQLRFTCSKL
ncbi:MAG: glycosyltransferase [Pseudomonadota bacterium]